MTILELAERRAAAQMRLGMLGQLNTPTKIEDRIAADAQYQLAQDIWAKCDADYRHAIADLTAEELGALSVKSVVSAASENANADK